jgi:hypothetical protein
LQQTVCDGLQLLTPSDLKNRIIEHSSSLVQTESGASMINGKAVTVKLTYQNQTCAEIIITETTHSSALQNDSSANINKYTTALWIIYDFSS